MREKRVIGRSKCVSAIATTSHISATALQYLLLRPIYRTAGHRSSRRPQDELINCLVMLQTTPRPGQRPPFPPSSRLPCPPALSSLHFSCFSTRAPTFTTFRSYFFPIHQLRAVFHSSCISLSISVFLFSLSSLVPPTPTIIKSHYFLMRI